MSANHHALGALNFYADTPTHSTSSRMPRIRLRHPHRAGRNALRRDLQFRDGLASRDIIGQAKGMLMERHQINAEEAFNRLRQLSQNSNTPVANSPARSPPTLTTLTFCVEEPDHLLAGAGVSPAQGLAATIPPRAGTTPGTAAPTLFGRDHTGAPRAIWARTGPYCGRAVPALEPAFYLRIC